MPRDGSGVYHRPPGTDGVPNTTISSSAYNADVADVEQDLNTPRPIVAGGTGASNAHDAMVNLSGEIAGQVVTNYDSAVWAAGSFYSAAGATSAPTANAFSGICYLTDANNITLEARDATTGLAYVRQKTAGIWGTWGLDQSSAYVLKAGDTMTGNLSINASSPILSINASGHASFILNKNTTGYTNITYGMNNDVERWSLQLGDSIAETGSNTGSNFSLDRYDDSGAFISSPITINRATGYTLFNPGLVQIGTANQIPSTNVLSGTLSASCITSNANYGVNGYINAAGNGWLATTSGYVGAFGFSGGSWALYATSASVAQGATVAFNTLLSASVAGGLATNYSFVAQGNINTQGSIYANQNVISGYANAASGTYYFGSDATKYLTCDGTNFSFSGTGNVNAGGAFVGQSFIGNAYWFQTGQWGWNWNNVNGDTVLLRQAANWTYWRASDGAMIHTYNAYKPGGGPWGDSSDIRIKNVLGDYTRGLAEIAQLHPVLYTLKGNHTDEPPQHNKTGDEEKDAELAKMPVSAPYPNSLHANAANAGTKFTGLVAQEAELVMPEMVTKRAAYIDGVAVNDLRDIDTTPLIFALVNACKELKARVEALEAKAA